MPLHKATIDGVERVGWIANSSFYWIDGSGTLRVVAPFLFSKLTPVETYDPKVDTVIRDILPFEIVDMLKISKTYAGADEDEVMVARLIKSKLLSQLSTPVDLFSLAIKSAEHDFKQLSEQHHGPKKSKLNAEGQATQDYVDKFKEILREPAEVKEGIIFNLDQQIQGKLLEDRQNSVGKPTPLGIETHPDNCYGCETDARQKKDAEKPAEVQENSLVTAYNESRKPTPPAPTETHNKNPFGKGEAKKSKRIQRLRSENYALRAEIERLQLPTIPTQPDDLNKDSVIQDKVDITPLDQLAQAILDGRLVVCEIPIQNRKFSTDRYRIVIEKEVK